MITILSKRFSTILRSVTITSLATRAITSRMSQFHTANRLKGFDAPTVWSEFTPLSQKYQSVNLGQGFPDWETPQFAKNAFIEAINANHNQYSRSAGDITLVESLAHHYGPLVGRTINPLTEVAVGVGASEILFAVMQSTLNEGDEVVVLEPTFDIYTAAIQMAGGISKAVPLELNRNTGKWELDFHKYEQAITPKTRLLLINTPHNPTGKVFSREELNQIGHLLQKYPHVTAVTDEVYEKLVYDEHEHVRLASLPGLWERTITVSSSGKTFSATGWKIGWCYGAEHLVKPVILANQWIQYCVSTPAQKAIAKILKEAEAPYEGYPSYYEYIKQQYLRKRNHLVASLRDGGFEPAVPEGGFFIMADTSKYDPPETYLAQPGLDGKPVTRDWAFARWLTIEKGITPIPPSAFYTQETKEKAANLARFAFCKTDELLEEAKKRFHEVHK